MKFGRHIHDAQRIGKLKRKAEDGGLRTGGLRAGAHAPDKKPQLCGTHRDLAAKSDTATEETIPLIFRRMITSQQVDILQCTNVSVT